MLTVRQVDEIVAASVTENSKAGMTGMLWFNGIHFAQVLEGDAEAIGATMRRIVKDSRHSKIDVISDGPADERLFGNWSMIRGNDYPETISRSMILLGQTYEMSSIDAPRLRDIVSSSLD